MRFGKRKAPMRFGKRGQPMRFGKRSFEEPDFQSDYAIIVKRIPLRFGKRNDFDYSDLY